MSAGLAAGIRPARPHDHAGLTALLVAQLREHDIATPAAEVSRAVDRLLRHPERGRLLLATDAGRAIGVAALSFVWTIEHGRRSAWLEELYVEPAARGRGIGGALLRAACEAAAGAGAVAIDLEVERGHERAARLYERAGFQPLARARWVKRCGPTTPMPAAAPPADATGGCLCGAVRYHADASPLAVVHCHCAICRRATGAPFVTWAMFAAAAFRFTAGTPTERRTTAEVVRTFCAACGTALTRTWSGRADRVAVTVGSLDRSEAAIPTHHRWTASQLPWLDVEDDLPRHRGADVAHEEEEP